MTDPPTGFTLIRLPRRGPKPGQSTESFLRGKAQADRQWQRLKDRNIGRLVLRSRQASRQETNHD
jgi:hypothetical protein